jgi:hypothetical protein
MRTLLVSSFVSFEDVVDSPMIVRHDGAKRR